MTYATYEFINAIKNKKLPKPVIILLTIAVIFMILYVLSSVYILFSKNDFSKHISFLPALFYVLSCVFGICGVLYMEYKRKKNFSYVENIKYGLVKDILEIMESKQLPLEIVAPMIRKDLEEHIIELKNSRLHYFNVTKKLLISFVFTPIVFLFSQYFGNLFSSEYAEQIEFFQAMLSFIMQLLPIALLFAMLTLMGYITLDYFSKDISGENSFSHYLNVLHEIEINIECDKIAAAKNFPKKQKVFCCKKHL